METLAEIVPGAVVLLSEERSFGDDATIKSGLHVDVLLPCTTDALSHQSELREALDAWVSNHFSHTLPADDRVGAWSIGYDYTQYFNARSALQLHIDHETMKAIGHDVESIKAHVRAAAGGIAVDEITRLDAGAVPKQSADCLVQHTQSPARGV